MAAGQLLSFFITSRFDRILRMPWLSVRAKLAGVVGKRSKSVGSASAQRSWSASTQFLQSIMLKSKKQLFDHLRQDVYCHLGVSKVHGIGVFAVRPIPKGIEPLRSLVKFDDIKFTHEEIKTLAPGVRREIEMFCYYDEQHVHVPRIGLNAANMSVYLNHSKTPNVEFKQNGELVSLRAIKKGEELLMDYDINFGAVHIFD